MDAILKRVRASSDRIADLEDELQAERARRDELMADARNEGKTFRQVAHAARLRASTVSDAVAVVFARRAGR